MELLPPLDVIPERPPDDGESDIELEQSGKLQSLLGGISEDKVPNDEERNTSSTLK
jgi:hypothetical protein